jgi:hypothetical protein
LAYLDAKAIAKVEALTYLDAKAIAKAEALA